MKKVIVISISVLLILLVLACCLIGYGDLLPGKPVPWDAIKMDSTGIVYYRGNLICANGLGTVVVAADSLDPKNRVIASWKGVFLDRVSTHLTMLSLREGMSLPQVIAAAGMPDGITGSGFIDLVYNTPDGYTYALRFGDNSETDDRTDMELGFLMLYTRDRGWLDSEEVNTFLWKMRFIYIGVAVLLSGVVVCLLTVPNAIRKKRAKSV